MDFSGCRVGCCHCRCRRRHGKGWIHTPSFLSGGMLQSPVVVVVVVVAVAVAVIVDGNDLRFGEDSCFAAVYSHCNRHRHHEDCRHLTRNEIH